MSMREAFSIGIKYFIVGFAIFFALWGGRPASRSVASESLTAALPNQISGQK